MYINIFLNLNVVLQSYTESFINPNYIINIGEKKYGSKKQINHGKGNLG